MCVEKETRWCQTCGVSITETSSTVNSECAYCTKWWEDNRIKEEEEEEDE